ncbi:MAG TPA: DUF6516 family protein [Candidatus Binatia bacterium]|nr:DUF6516 family protein [Candidatus Binatia bacterium]
MPSRKPSRHGWNSWKGYLAAHRSKLAQYEDHFLVEDGLEYSLTWQWVTWEGVLRFRDGHEIQVTRRQKVERRRGEPWVRTVEYVYHALRRDESSVRNLFRYDNIHVHPGHETPHHRHAYDAAGQEVQPPEHVGEAGWPTLGEVIDELHDLWQRERWQVSSPHPPPR